MFYHPSVRAVDRSPSFSATALVIGSWLWNILLSDLDKRNDLGLGLVLCIYLSSLGVLLVAYPIRPCHHPACSRDVQAYPEASRSSCRYLATLGGMEGMLSQKEAIYGLEAVTKPLIIQGSDPFLVLFFAVFEKAFYWVVILLISRLLKRESLRAVT